MSGGDGIGAALAQAMAEAGALVEPAPVQVALPLGDAEAIEAARDLRPDRDAGHAVQAVRKAGRPKGASNKRTGQLRDYLLSRYAHPLEVLAQAYSRPVETLAAELGCSKVEAFGLQVRAAAELAPFIESKMPVAVGIDARGTVQLVIHGGEAAGGAVIDAEGVTLGGLSAMLQNQGVIEE
jgi:hypothetical protein